MNLEQLEQVITAAVHQYWEAHPPKERGNLGIEIDSDACSTTDRGLVVHTDVLVFPEDGGDEG